MNPHSKHRPLIFTPRSPWGGRLESRSFRRHMRASEDEQRRPTAQESFNQLKAQADAHKDVTQLDPTKNAPVGLPGQVSPERAEEIMYDSQRFPKTPRMPRTPSELGLDPNNPTPQTAAPGAPLPAATTAQLGQDPNQIPVKGGPQNTIPSAPPEWKDPTKLKVNDRLEVSPWWEMFGKGGAGFRGTLKGKK